VSYDHKTVPPDAHAYLGRDRASESSNQTEFGRKLLAEDPHGPGSLGIAISEAI